MGLPANARMAHDARHEDDPHAAAERRYSPLALQRSLDPFADAAAWFEYAMQGQAPPPVLAVIGLGYGHLLAVLEVVAPQTRVLALEPDPQIAREVLARREWLDWRTTGRLLYLIGPDYAGASDAARQLPASRPSDYRVLVHPGLAEDANVDAVAAARTLKRILSGAKLNAEARRAFAPRYLQNTLANIDRIVDQGDVAALTGAADQTPAILVAAGPSLDAQLEALRELQDRAVIIAVDTAFRPLRAAGISPHFVVALDPSEANARHLLGTSPTQGTCLVAEGSVDPRVCRAFDDVFFFQVSNHEPWPWLSRYGVACGRLSAWGSVLTTAVDLARRLGCDPLVFAGADLAFTDERPYCRGTVYEEGWRAASDLGYDLHFTWRSEIEARHPVDTLDLHGRPTQSTAALEAFRDWVVEQSRRPPRRQFINTTGAGILFGGRVQQRTLNELKPGPSLGPIRDRFRALRVRRPEADIEVLTARVTSELAGWRTNDLGRRWAAFTMLAEPSLGPIIDQALARLSAGCAAADSRELA
ncbi:MAG: motility associated factor glycosyltransferase family protein [Vicinamibacterales bacterium]